MRQFFCIRLLDVLHIAGDHSHTFEFRSFTSCLFTNHAYKQCVALLLKRALDLLMSLSKAIIDHLTRLCTSNFCGFLKILYILTIRFYPPFG